MNPGKVGTHLAFLLPFVCFFCVTSGCGGDEPIHASLLEPTATPLVDPYPLNDSRWSCPVNEDEYWIYANTLAEIRIPEQVSETFDVYFEHIDGTLVIGDTTVPPETWGMGTGTWIASRSQLVVSAKGVGHTLNIDADVRPCCELNGWFIFDTDYEVFLRCDRL